MIWKSEEEKKKIIIDEDVEVFGGFKICLGVSYGCVAVG